MQVICYVTLTIVPICIPAGWHWSTWFSHSIICIRITTSGICVLFVSKHTVFQSGLERRITGNATVSLLGDVATHFVILFCFYWECCQEVWQTVWNLSLLEELRVQISPFPKVCFLFFIFIFIFIFVVGFLLNFWFDYEERDALTRLFVLIVFEMASFCFQCLCGFPVLWMLISSSQRKPGMGLGRFLMPICLKHQR